MKKQWRCFHCDQLFRSEREARIHFGIDDLALPACKISQAEGHLVEYIRKLEGEIAEYRNESHQTLLAAYGLQMEARAIEPEAEQRGYDKGVSETWVISDTWAMARGEDGLQPQSGR